MTQSPKLDGTSWALVGILSVLWGSTFMMIEIGLRSYSPMMMVFLRMALAVPPMLLALWWMKQSLPTDAKSWWMLTVVGWLNCTFPFMLFYWGQQYLDSGYASILNATTPVWGVIAAHFMTQDEKATAPRVIGVLFGMAGIVTMVGPQAIKGLSTNVLAQLACIISTISYSLAAIYGRRLSQTSMTPMVVATGQTLTATLLILPVILFYDQPWNMGMPRLDSTIAAVASALLSTALAYMLYFRVIDRAGASNAQVIAFLMPVLAVILGISFLDEKLTGGQIAGAALIAAGLVIIDGRLFARLAPRRAVL